MTPDANKSAVIHRVATKAKDTPRAAMCIP